MWNHRTPLALSREPEAAEASGPVAIVVNPVHRRGLEAVEFVRAHLRRAGAPEPVVLQTTIAEPGRRQARDALECGAIRILAIGGDGTVREVAHELAGQPADLGILACGTANLFALNLGLTRLSAADQVRAALAGRRARVDLGSATFTTADGARADGSFLVVAGFGLDALTIARVPQRLKRRIGWPAYIGPWASTIAARPSAVTVTADEQPPRTRTAWSTLAVNAGRLPAGVQTAPEALLDDGLLDLLEVTARGPQHWAAIAAKGVAGRHGSVPGLTHHPVSRVRVDAAEPQLVHFDGDVIGPVTSIDLRVRPGAISVRVADR